MKNYAFKKILSAAICGAVAFMCFSGFAADPGSSDDPLISMSYVNDVLTPQLKSYVDSQINTAMQSQSHSTDSKSSVFNIVNVSAGQTVIGAKSCQMIVRSGSGKVVSSAKGGLADVTSGGDLTTGMSAPANHLLIVPIDDWRGITMVTDGIIMINGTYSVNQ